MNYNIGLPIDLDSIEDFYKAAKDFSEGNKELEKLLLNCHELGIKTHACCAGHKGENAPYIAIKYSKETKNFLYFILLLLERKGYHFLYNKLINSNSSISISEVDNFDLSTESTLFHDINEAIKKYKKHINYFAFLSQDLRTYFKVISYIEIEDIILPDEYNDDVFQLGFSHNNRTDYNNYWLITSDLYYSVLSTSAGFDKTAYENYYFNNNLSGSANALEKLYSKIKQQKRIEKISVKRSI